MSNLFTRFVGSRRHDRIPDLGLDIVETVWEEQAQADPLWAVLSEPEKRGRRWDLDEFMATGEEQLTKALARYEELGGTLPDYETAVDFGSGVGRLTQPLGRRFRRAIGIDISPTMIAVARRLNEHPDSVDYVLNSRPDLRFLADRSVSLVFTHITLQHLPPEAAEAYLIEFLRVVKPGGGIVFQLPSHYADSYLPHDSDDSPVPETARRAEIALTNDCSEAVEGADLEMVVDVTNQSDTAWIQSATRPLRIGNHWVDANDSQVVIHDDGRTRLPGRLLPGETARVSIDGHAPATAGRYRLQIDVVQEGEAWFADFGSGVFETTVEVTPKPTGVDPSPEAGGATYADQKFDDLISAEAFDATQFEMNAIPRPRVEALLERHGATLLGTDEWVTEWHSFTYFVQAGDGGTSSHDRSGSILSRQVGRVARGRRGGLP